MNSTTKFIVFVVGFILFVTIFMRTMNYYLGPLSYSKELNIKGLKIKLISNRKKVDLSQPINLKLIIINPTSKPIVIERPDNKFYDFIVIREYNLILFKFYLEVWRYSYGKIYKRAHSKWVIKPHQRIVYTTTWNLTDASGKKVGPGRYLIIGTVYTAEGQKNLRLSTK